MKKTLPLSGLAGNSFRGRRRGVTCQKWRKSLLGSRFPLIEALYMAFKRMSPQGISVGVSGVILLIIRSLNVPGVVISR